MVKKDTTDRDRGRVRDRLRSCSPRRPVRRQGQRPRPRPGVSCSIPIQIGMEGPFTGPGRVDRRRPAPLGEFFAATVWNKSHKVKINIVQGDTQLDPAIASTVSQSFASNSSIVGVIGPAGSQEVIACGADPEEGRARLRLRLGDEPALTNGKLRGLLLPRRPERLACRARRTPTT